MIIDKRKEKIDSRIKQLIQIVDHRLGLEQYILKKYELQASVNQFYETTYFLMMEWLPKHKLNELDTGLNPNGTAIIEFEIHQQKFKQIIFVGEKSYATKYPLKKTNKNAVLSWLRSETVLAHLKDSQLKKSIGEQFSFQIVYKETPLYPSVLIEVKLDEQGRIVQFSQHGHFPKKASFLEENFNLTIDNLKSISKQQCQYIQWEEDDGFLPKAFYSIKEAFITNDTKRVLPQTMIDHEKPYVYINKRLFWDNASTKPFKPEIIDQEQKIIIESAFANEDLADAKPISQEEQDNCLQAVKNFMRQKYRADSGKWRLDGLYRDAGLIHALLRLNEDRFTIIGRKLTLIIDPEKFAVLNFVDNDEFLNSLGLETSQAEAIISEQEAFQQLKGHLKVSPYYVYDQRKQNYILCGKLHCPFVVDAYTGELIKL